MSYYDMLFAKNLGGGGGGGGSQNEFTRVFHTQTSEDATYILIDKDDNGNNLSFDEAYVFVTTTRASSATANGSFGITLKSAWATSFNKYCLYNNQLPSDVYCYCFHIRKVGEMAGIMLEEKLRVGSNISSAYYQSEATWGGTKAIAVDAGATTSDGATSFRNASDVVDANGKLCTILLGVDTASAVKIGSGTLIEVFAR